MRLLVPAIALVALAGCAGPGAHKVDWSREALLRKNYPDEYRRVYVAPVTVSDVSPVSTAGRMLPEEHWRVEPRKASTIVETVLAQTGVFPEVVTYSPNDSSSSGLLLEISLEEAVLAHEGETDEASKAFWLWLFTGYPGLGVRDQLYSIRYEPKVRVTDLRTQEVLVPWEPLAAPDPGPYALNFHERTTGVGSYLKTNIMPPSSISIDPDEVLKEILPASLRPTVNNLIALFDQISFLPASRIELTRPECPGVRVEDVRSSQEETKDDTTNVTLVLTLAETVRDLREVLVGGERRLVFEKGSPSVAPGKTVEIPLGNIEVPPGSEVGVDLVFDGVEKPQRILTLKAIKGSPKPERHR